MTTRAREGEVVEPSEPLVALVTHDGKRHATMAKLAAHQAPGQLHAAFSVLLHKEGKLLLAQRAAEKYHFPLHWSNACCSHPFPDEDVAAGAARRVREELGCDAALTCAGSFIYRAICPSSGLVEHEYDTVFVGELRDTPRPDPAEVAALELVAPADLIEGRFPGRLTPWLVPALLVARAELGGF